MENNFKTIIYLINKLNNHSQVIWVESKKALSDKLLNEFKNDADTKVLINPLDEWTEFPFENIQLIHFAPGVTDNKAVVCRELFQELDSSNKFIQISSGDLFFDKTQKYNPLIQLSKTINKDDLLNGERYFPATVAINHNSEILKFDLSLQSDAELVKLSNERKLALSLDEMLAIKAYFQREDIIAERAKIGLDHRVTDIELEVFAQTWSEHCKHKIFAANIEFSENGNIEKIKSIYKTYIKGSTFEINKKWAVSVFNDNAGVVDWLDDHYLAIKVETHNSPSALDPYGGALTGILGVNRDILGTGLGFSPIANTNVFCVGNWDKNYQLPNNLLSPKEILTGVHHGIMDGGNKSGIPTVNGAIQFDDNFCGKPLVYCGTVGVAPKNTNHIDNKNKYTEAGDLIIMAGGRVGLDGIHGATMSSIGLDETVPKTMVQIGDPFTQKKLADYVLALRDLGLIKGLTDNGAGGLSSSLGEMAEKTNGAKINIDSVPLKYSGLSPWEIFVSESQERMSLAISPENKDYVLNLANNFGVEASVIGEFTNTGRLNVLANNQTILNLDLEFLHTGLPTLNLKAEWNGSIPYKSFDANSNLVKMPIRNHNEILQKLFTDPNIASKEGFIRQYDHEVKGSTIVKPIEAINSKTTSPNDSGVIWLNTITGDTSKAVAIGCGIQYQFSHIDPSLMAKLSVDEAVRNIISTGASPNHIAMTDNFCWPDPIQTEKNPDGKIKLGQLVKTCKGLSEITRTYKMPLISGKDSMKNDYINGDLKISVPPTLLITAMGLVPDTKQIKKTAIKNSGKLIYQLGLKFNKNYFGHYLQNYFDINSDPNFNWDLDHSLNFYQLLHQNLNLIESIHDVSDGGVLPALLESLFLNNLGITIDSNLVSRFDTHQWYSEYPTNFIISISPANQEKFEEIFKDNFEFIGTTDLSGMIQLGDEKISVSHFHQTWRKIWV